MADIFNTECDKIDTGKDTQQLYNDVENLMYNTFDKTFKKTKKKKTHTSSSSHQRYIYNAVTLLIKYGGVKFSLCFSVNMCILSEYHQLECF